MDPSNLWLLISRSRVQIPTGSPKTANPDNALPSQRRAPASARRTVGTRVTSPRPSNVPSTSKKTLSAARSGGKGAVAALMAEGAYPGVSLFGIIAIIRPNLAPNMPRSGLIGPGPPLSGLAPPCSLPPIAGPQFAGVGRPLVGLPVALDRA